MENKVLALLRPKAKMTEKQFKELSGQLQKILEDGKECLNDNQILECSVDVVCDVKRLALLPHGLEVLKCLLTEKSAQTILNYCFGYGIYNHWTEYGFMNIVNNLDDLTAWSEVIRLCLAFGAKPAKDIVDCMASVANWCKHTNLLSQFETFHKLIISYHKEFGKPAITCELSILSNLYIVKAKISEMGHQIICTCYRTFERCLASESVINTLLYISTWQSGEKEYQINKRKFDSLMDVHVENWFQRSILHLAVAFMDNENALEYIPKSIVKKYLDARDLHGCTPLHIAYLHHNDQAIRFLESNGARIDTVDNYGMMPESLGARARLINRNGTLENEYYYKTKADAQEDHPDVVYQRLCQSIMESKSGILQKLKPMLIMPEDEAEMLCVEMKELFRRIMQVTEYHKYVKAELSKLKSELHQILVKSLSKIDWTGIHLRIISTSNPWEFVWEGPGATQGVTISVDVVLLLISPTKDDCELIDIETGKSYDINYVVPYRKCDVAGKYREHFDTQLIKWKKWPVLENAFWNSYCCYEWDILDALSPGKRLGIVIAKALLQAFYWNSGGKLSFLKFPVKSYMVKTALFFLLSGHPVEIGYFKEANILFGAKWEDDVEIQIPGALRKTTSYYSDDNGSGKEDSEREETDESGDDDEDANDDDDNCKWFDDADVDEYAEEGRMWAYKIFTTIFKFSELGEKLDDFWDGSAVPCDDFESELLAKICIKLLQCLHINKFY